MLVIYLIFSSAIDEWDSPPNWRVDWWQFFDIFRENIDIEFFVGWKWVLFKHFVSVATICNEILDDHFVNLLLVNFFELGDRAFCTKYFCFNHTWMNWLADVVDDLDTRNLEKLSVFVDLMVSMHWMFQRFYQAFATDFNDLQFIFKRQNRGNVFLGDVAAIIFMVDVCADSAAL